MQKIQRYFSYKAAPFFGAANVDTNARCLYKFNALHVAAIARMMIQPAQSVEKDSRQLTK